VCDAAAEGSSQLRKAIRLFIAGNFSGELREPDS
jgi:hypothetical protein